MGSVNGARPRPILRRQAWELDRWREMLRGRAGGIEGATSSGTVRITAEPLLRAKPDGIVLQSVRIAPLGHAVLPDRVSVVDDTGAPVPSVIESGPHGSTRVLVPAVSHPTRVRLLLDEAAGGPDLELVLPVVRRWSVHLVHYSHLDIGYTDPQPIVMQQQSSYLDSALDLVEATDDWADDAKFRWCAESLWPFQRWVATRPPRRVDALMERVKERRIELSAMPFNLHTETCSTAELFELLRGAREVADRWGTPLVSAMQTDVPGAVAGLPDALGEAGVRYLSVAHNWAGRSVPHLVGGDGLPRLFRWRGAAGHEVLVWMTDTPHGLAYAEGSLLGLNDSVEAVDDLLPAYLGALASNPYPYGGELFGWAADDAPVAREPYPYDLLHLRVIGRLDDNTAPRRVVAEIVRDWNRRWSWPRLRLSTNVDFFEAAEAAIGDLIPSLSGDWNDWWADGIGAGAEEMAIQRESQAMAPDAATVSSLAGMLGAPAVPGEADASRTIYESLALFDEHSWGAADPWGDDDTGPRSGGRQWHWKVAQALDAYDRVTDAMASALTRLGDRVPPSPTALATFVVANTCGWTRSDIVTAFLPDAVVDARTGQTLPVDVDEPENLPHHDAGRVLRILVADVPPVGIVRLDVVAAPPGPAAGGDATAPPGLDGPRERPAVRGSRPQPRVRRLDRRDRHRARSRGRRHGVRVRRLRVRPVRVGGTVQPRLESPRGHGAPRAHRQPQPRAGRGPRPPGVTGDRGGPRIRVPGRRRPHDPDHGHAAARRVARGHRAADLEGDDGGEGERVRRVPVPLPGSAGPDRRRRRDRGQRDPGDPGRGPAHARDARVDQPWRRTASPWRGRPAMPRSSISAACPCRMRRSRRPSTPSRARSSPGSTTTCGTPTSRRSRASTGPSGTGSPPLPPSARATDRSSPTGRRPRRVVRSWRCSPAASREARSQRGRCSRSGTRLWSSSTSSRSCPTASSYACVVRLRSVSDRPVTTAVRPGLPVVAARRATYLGSAGRDPAAHARGEHVMSLFDLPLDQLVDYRPEREEPEDFDRFWADTLDEARAAARPPTFAPAHPELRALEVFDVTFSGFAGQPVKAWLIVPRHRSGPVPVVVEYVGYGGGRGLPSWWLAWPSAGYATFVMDTRGQGGAFVPGATPDSDPEGMEPQVAGWLTRGIMDPSRYFYRRVFTDAAMAVTAARAHPAVDRDRVVVSGGSQGGGITLAAAALDGTAVAACVDVPFLCHWRRAATLTDDAPYSELRAYLSVYRDRVDQVFRTLSYMDGVNFASRATAPALFSVGLMDTICPPSTVFAAYNHYAGPKDIRVWPFNGHDAGQVQGVHERIAFLDAQGIRPPEVG
jgi:cephalosporin-C deacetylase-like acetyl esterase